MKEIIPDLYTTGNDTAEIKKNMEDKMEREGGGNREGVREERREGLRGKEREDIESS